MNINVSKIYVQRRYNMPPRVQPQVGKKTLIIASGDCSDADGFLTIPLYKASGADVLYFVNFSAIFNDKGCEFDYTNPYDPKRQDIRAKEYPVMSSTEYAIPGFVHRGNWKEFYSNKFRDFSKYALINPNFKNILTDSDGKEANHINPTLFKDVYEAIHFKQKQTSYGTATTDYNSLNRAAKDNISNKQWLKQEILNTFYELMYRMISKIWSETLPYNTNKIFIVGYHGQTLNTYYAKLTAATLFNAEMYHLNAVNPFALYLLGDDVDTYANIFSGENAEYRNEDLYYKKTVFEGLPEDVSYNNVYLDFNGSMSFYSVHKDWIVENFMDKSANGKITSGKIKGVYMMGGVEAQEPPKTLSMFSIVRYSCATMNQVFHPKNTIAFLKDMSNAGVPIHVATNNYVNRHDVWDLSGKNGEIEPENALKKLFETHGNWIPNSETLIKVLFAYYGDEARLVRIYDVPVAMKLVSDIKKISASTPLPDTDSVMYLCDRGITIVDKNKDIQWTSVVSNYTNKLGSKFHPSFVDTKTHTIPPFKPIHNTAFIALQQEKLTLEGGGIDKATYPISAANPLSANLEKLTGTNIYHAIPCSSFDEYTESLLSEFGIKTGAYPPFNGMSVKSVLDKAKANIAQTRKVQQNSQVDYDFSDQEKVLVISDWEGGMPVIRSKELQEYFNFKCNMLHLHKPDCALVVLGDLIDNATYNIRLMHSMLKLKNDPNKKILLIGGNRDFNKIRLADEHFMMWKDDVGYYPCLVHPTFEGKTFQQAVDIIVKNIGSYSFLFDHFDIVNNGYKVKPWHINNMNLFERTLVDRVNRVYLDMYGIGVSSGDPNVASDAVQYIFTELVELGFFPRGQYNAVYMSVAVTIFNMLASRTWVKDEVEIKFDNDGIDGYGFEALNGLYVRYMQQCHIAEIFKKGEHYGLVSHGAFGMVDDHLTSELGLSYELTMLREMLIPYTNKASFKSEPLHTILNKYEILKNEVLKPVLKPASWVGLSKDKTTNEFKTAKYNLLIRQNPNVQQMIHMTAGTKYFTEEGFYAYHHSLSPVLGYRAPKSAKSSMKFGGNKHRPYAKPLATEIMYTNLLEGSTTFKWVIYGHQPRGIVPAVDQKENTYYICMDVSKIEGQTNNDSFSALLISNDSNATIFGKIALSKLEKNTTILTTPGTTAPTEMMYTISLDKLMNIQNRSETIIKYDYDNIIGKGNADELKLSPVMTSGELDYFYISEFMGTSPSPVISNKIFISAHDPSATSKSIDFGTFTQSGGAKKRLSKMTLKELKNHAKMIGIKGSSKMDQKELIKSIKTIKKGSKSKSKKSVVIVD